MGEKGEALGFKSIWVTTIYVFVGNPLLLPCPSSCHVLARCLPVGQKRENVTVTSEQISRSQARQRPGHEMAFCI